ncbi:MAG: HlyD family efflux transporter periplasmic adaptor subunit [Phycisphaerales bacterium]|nr:HlyD family efflux transporter periplasmic adaptor subunit [Phycisphaerales bacterium]
MTNAKHLSPTSIRFITRIAVPVTILGGAALLLGWTAWNAFQPLPDVRVAPVAMINTQSAQSAQGGASSGGIQAPGWIEPQPFATEVTPLREGVVTEVIVLEGDRVEKNQVVARLDSAAQVLALRRTEGEFHAAEGELLAAEAEAVGAARALELQLEATVMLAEAQAKFKGADAMLDGLRAEVTEARAMRDESQDELTRKSRLLATGGTSEGELQRLALRVEALSAAMQAKTSACVGQTAEREAAAVALTAAETSRKELLMERAKAASTRGAHLAAQGMRDAKQAMRDEAALMLARSEVRAPMAGVVLQRLAIPGAMVGGTSEASAKPILLLYDPNLLQVRVDVPLKNAANVSVGAKAEIRVDALPNQVFEGEVVLLVPLADLQKNTAQCKVSIRNPVAALRPDMLARVRISVSGETNTHGSGEGVAVPEEALRTSATGATEVLVALPRGNALVTERRVLVLGSPLGNGWIEVQDGLAFGDRVVLDAAISEGMRIRGIEVLKGELP